MWAQAISVCNCFHWAVNAYFIVHLCFFTFLHLILNVTSYQINSRRQKQKAFVHETKWNLTHLYFYEDIDTKVEVVQNWWLSYKMRWDLNKESRQWVFEVKTTKTFSNTACRTMLLTSAFYGWWTSFLSVGIPQGMGELVLFDKECLSIPQKLYVY